MSKFNLHRGPRVAFQEELLQIVIVLTETSFL